MYCERLSRAESASPHLRFTRSEKFPTRTRPHSLGYNHLRPSPERGSPLHPAPLLAGCTATMRLEVMLLPALVDQRAHGLEHRVAIGEIILGCECYWNIGRDPEPGITLGR